MTTRVQQFPEDHAVLCPECFKRPESATLEVSPGPEYTYPDMPITMKSMDRVERVSLSCGHEFRHFMYFFHEIQNVKPERVIVWNFR